MLSNKLLTFCLLLYDFFKFTIVFFLKFESGNFNIDKEVIIDSDRFFQRKREGL